MHFADTSLQDALIQWRTHKDAKEHSKADNIWFEQRVGASRQRTFEDEARGAAGPVGLHNALARYWGDFVRVGDGMIPETFAAGLMPASLGEIDDTQEIVRIEKLTRPLAARNIDMTRLKRAFESGEKDLVAAFVAEWNTLTMRDGRPAFAAFRDEVNDDLKLPDWADRLRDRLGLAHHDCAAGPIPIALMKYTVAEVNAAAKKAGVSSPFTAPTVLDSEPWPYFFPAPPKLPCGRTMALYEVSDGKDLLAEFLHMRIEYKPNHISRLGEIAATPPAVDLRTLRNGHLLALREAASQDDFGEVIPI